MMIYSTGNESTTILITWKHYKYTTGYGAQRQSIIQLRQMRISA